MRAERDLRSRLTSQSQTKASRKPAQAQDRPIEPPAAKKSRMAKKLENCPGVSSTSASGKIIRPLPVIWSEMAKREPKSELVDDIKPRMEDLDITGLGGSGGFPAGLFDPDATFSFSADDKDGKLVVYQLLKLS